MEEQVNQIAIKAAEEWVNKYPQVAQRGIDEGVWNALSTSVFPGAQMNSILMAVDYCKSRNLDVLMKPVHIVPMYVDGGMRDVIMPGVGLYRIQAERSGNNAGSDAPEFGPMITKTLKDKEGKPFEMTFPEWCKFTVHKTLASGDKASYVALEYWEENYAVQKKTCTAPNAMWAKRPRGQLAKCAEAQALRRGWPEIGQDATYEEMEGKEYVANSNTGEREINPTVLQRSDGFYSDDDFAKNYPAWEGLIVSKKKTHSKVLSSLAKKNIKLTEDQIKLINDIKVG